jgi:putative oxidoreductase
MWGTTYSVARALLPLLFVVEGLLKLANIDGIASALEVSGLPIPAQFDAFGTPRFVLLGYIVAWTEVVCGLLVMVGFLTRPAALILVAFVLGTIVVAHPFWAMEGPIRAVNMTQALKNLSIIAGLLMVAALGAGRCSLAGLWRR